MENIYNLVNQTLAGGIHKIAPPLSRSVRHGESVDANPKGSPSEGAPLLAGFARSGITNPQGAPSLSIPILARQGGEVDLSSESESPKVAPSLSRSVRQGGSRDSGSLDSNLDHTRLQWSRWIRCESSFSVLLVPAKAGIFALGEEMVPAGDGSKRMLALFEISATDDLGMTLGRLFLPGNPLLAKLNAGRCFVRYTVIEDAGERSAVYSAFSRWMQESAETASGIGSCGAGALAREVDPCGSDIPVRAPSGVETDCSSSIKALKDNSPSTSSAWGVGFTEAPNREAKEVVRRPRPLPSGF
jgi:hypothetical protein